MFTPQRLWSGRNNTPNKRGSGHDLGVISGEGSKGKGVENGGNLDREVLVERVSNLEKELYEYQFNMGLLLIEKKEWNSNYNELSQDIVEVKDALEQEKAAHLFALSEAEKREENLRKALGVEKECVLDLEKALREMRSEHAKIKFAADSKLAEANALIASVEEKSLEVEAKLRSADAKLAEISRKSSEIDRKSHDLESQESALRRERLSFIAEQESHESTLSKQREDLREWEKKLQDGEERLAKGQRILNEREQRANDIDKICRQKEKDLEEAQKNIDAANVTLRSKEDDVNSRLATITLNEKECDSMRMNLDFKEKELSAWEEKLNAREKVEIQKLVDDHSAALDAKKQEFEIELEEKRKSFEDGLRDRLVEVEKKEGEVSHMEEKVAKREQALEKRAEKLKEKEKEHEVKVKALKEREKSLKSEEKDLGKEKGQIESEREELLSLKSEVEKLRANNEEELLRIKEETNRLQVTEEERSEYIRLQSQLKHEIDQYRQQKELLMKEADDLRQQKETFEREWDELDLKRADVEKELKNVLQQKEEILKLQQNEEERLKKEKQATEDYLQRELETLQLAKESFAAEMELEKSSLAEKAQNEKNQLLLDFEMRRKELEADMQNQLEQKEKDLFESRRLFEEKRESELNNINFLREVANRGMEEMKHQRSKLEREKQDADENRKHVERQRIEMQEDIDVLVDLNKKLKSQREQFIVERRRFIDVVEKLQSCQNCGEMISEFVLSDLQSSADIENLEVPSLPKLVGDITQGGSDVNLDSSRQNTGASPATDTKSPVPGGTVSWLRKCTSKIFKISPIKKIESDVDNLRSVDTLPFDKTNEDLPANVPGTENEAELSFAIADDSFDVPRVQSGNDITDTEVEADHEPSIDKQGNIDATATDYLQPPNSKAGQQKPRRGGGVRARVKRTQTVKAVIKEAEAFLGESKAAEAVPGESVDDRETDFPNGIAEDSANMDSESQNPDDFERFSYFCRASLDYIVKCGKQPDILHLHNWETAIVAPLFWDVFVNKGLGGTRILLTIHNFNSQGTEQPDKLALCGLDPSSLHCPDRLQDNTNTQLVNILKGGVVYSNRVVIMSSIHPKHAIIRNLSNELEPTLNVHGDKLSVAPYGFEKSTWDPQTDYFLPENFNAENMNGKAVCKVALLQRLGLSEHSSTILVGCSFSEGADIDEKKMKDIVLNAKKHDVQFIFMETSERPDLNQALESLHMEFKDDDNIKFVRSYDEALSHLLFAGSDSILCRSFHDPTDETPLKALRYGAVPIAVDSDSHTNRNFINHDQEATKYSKLINNTFGNMSLGLAIDELRSNPSKWKRRIMEAMAHDLSWDGECYEVHVAAYSAIKNM